MSARFHPFWLGLFCLLLACDSGNWLKEQSFGEAAKWNVNQSVDFKYDNPVSGQKSLALDIAFSAEYPYQNIWFKLEMTDPKGQASEIIFGDTLMDVGGIWIGKQDVGSSVDWQLQPQPQIELAEVGTYQFKLSQHMREEELEGIQALKVNVE